MAIVRDRPHPMRLRRPRPARLAHAGFGAQGREVATETIELAFERIEIE